MSHLPILPLLLPLLMGALLLLPPLANSIKRQRIATLVTLILLLAVSLKLVFTAQESGTQMYVLGNWHPPFGIVLVADQLSSLLVLLTAVLAFGALLYACAGSDTGGMYFHPLFMFQVLGINGAFLTGDIFNLFVFFEVLLIASYALLVHGGGKQKTQSALHYVILNLIGSSLFLFGLGILYGTVGTLNIADMAIKIAQLHGGEAILAKIGGLLLMLVFGLKAALLPLHFWLPRTYASASAPVAALFAIMTKVGIYSLLRVHTVIFGDHAGDLANIAQPWLWPLSILTVSVGTLGLLASRSLRLLAANLVVVSAGTLLIAVALQTATATSAALYYLVHSTLAAGALFLLADLISIQRGKAEDRFVKARSVLQPKLLGSLFFVASLALIGLPPLSGFVGKVMLLQATAGETTTLWVWTVLLFSGLAALVALSRAGTTLFWRTTYPPAHFQLKPNQSNPMTAAHPLQIAAVVWLLLASPLLVVFGGDMTALTASAAQQLHDIDQSVYGLLPPISDTASQGAQ